jgi:undecaprenyl-phosphate galactose phosphotransferase
MMNDCDKGRKLNNTYGFIYRFVKRCFDILIGIIGCVLLLPLMLIVKILQIIMGDRGPLIYTQTRIGLKGKAFKIYKFRTMMTDADESLSELLNEDAYKKEWDAKQKLKEDPRITKLGRYLRKAAIDELPQLINVLKGDMSLVGPRPLVPGELERHGGLPLYNDVKPGMTGWWICNGHQDADYDKRLELEYHYVRNCSLWMDVLCLIKTAAHMIGEKADHLEKEDLPQAAESADFSVSVIIPTLNAEDYLPTLLDSLHKQSASIQDRYPDVPRE